MRRSQRLGVLRGESGQTLVLAALAMVALVGFLGLSIDAGLLRHEKVRLQTAADAAAQAGALELTSCAGTPNCAALVLAARDAVAENGLGVAQLSGGCTLAAASTLKIAVHNPPCMNANDPHRNDAGYVEVVLAQQVPTLFARVLGIASVDLLARGEATRSGTPRCLYALNRTAAGAVTLDDQATLTSTCALVVESSSSAALRCAGSGTIDAPAELVAGGAVTGGCSLSHAATTGAVTPVPADPLARLPAPVGSACGSSTASPYHGANTALTISGTATLYPDRAYCGGIAIAAGASVTFAPGLYVLRATPGGMGGGLTLDEAATVSGSDVTFYSTAGSITFKATGAGNGITLVAPTTGTYAGLLLWQDAQDTQQATIVGSAGLNTRLEGAYYFPGAKVLLGYDGTQAYNLLVADQVELTRFTQAGQSGGSGLTSNYTSLPAGSPVPAAGAAVME